jgi:hypothetical protein
MEELFIKSNGQWVLEKAAPKLNPTKMVEGKHTVEVHPDIDHLYNVKGLINESGKNSMKISHLKQQGVDHGIIKKLPRDAHGNVTPDMIDKHIESLPKHKVDIHVKPSDVESQKHNSNPQMVATVHMSDHRFSLMNPADRKKFNTLHQHSFATDPSKQVGWGRIDDTSHGNWHIDEIQSDLQHLGKLDINSDEIWDQSRNAIDNWLSEKKGTGHPSWGKINTLNEKMREKDIGVAAMHEHWREMTQEASKHIPSVAPWVKDEAMSEGGHWSIIDPNHFKNSDDKRLIDHISHGHKDPQHMIHSALNALARKHNVGSISMDTPEDQTKQSKLNSVTTPNHQNPYLPSNLPVHQVNTYDKRPKKLGMRRVSKDHIFEDAGADEEVQWMKLHKALTQIRAILKNTDTE